MTSPPPGFRSEMLRANGIEMHVVHNGPPFIGEPLADSRPALVCLHGFPEFWACWEKVASELGDELLIVIPDQRGCNRTEAPEGPEQYTSKQLVADVVELARRLLGRRRFALAGHDFGASVAYALVFAAPALVERLIVVNGAHPVCLQEAVLDDPDQALASQYFHDVRAAGAGARQAADGFAAAFAELERHSRHRWLTEDVKERFRAAWEGPERLEAMFHWYRASPIVVPVAGEPLPRAPLYGAPREPFRVPMAHLVIWGLDDAALLPSSRARLAEFCDDLTVREVAGADHWILHTHPTVAARHMREFLLDPARAG